MDISNLTLGEIAVVEQLSGRAFAEIADETSPKGMLMAALAFVIMKRDDPKFTFDDAKGLTMQDINAIITVDGDEKKG